MLAGSAIAQHPIAGSARTIFLEAAANASISLALTGNTLVQRQADGLAQVVVSSTGDVVRGITSEGLAQVQVDSAGDFVRRAQAGAFFGIEVAVDGDFRVVPPASAVFNIRMYATADLESKTPKYGDAWFLIETRAIGYEIKRNTFSPAMPMVIRTSAKGAGNIQAGIKASRAQIELYATGELDKGRKLYGSGRAKAAELFMRGAIDTRHYVYAAGSAQVSIQLIDNGYGIPPIPATFINAPAERTMYSAPERQTMYATRNRSIAP